MKQKLKNVKAMYNLLMSCIKYNQNSIGRNISMSYSMKKTKKCMKPAIKRQDIV